MMTTRLTADRLAERVLRALALANVLFVLSVLLVLLIATKEARAEGPGCGGSDLVAMLAKEDPGMLEAVYAEAAGTPNGKGLLWKIEKDGTEPSFLFGTMHIGDPRVLDLAPPVRDAFEAAETLALELADLDDPQAMAAALFSSAQLTMLPGTETLFDHLSAEERNLVEDGLMRRGIPPYSVRRMSPWLLYLTLSYPQCEFERQRQGDLALDAMLSAKAKEAGKRTVGLESFEEQLSILAGTPLEMQLQWLVDTMRLGERLDDFIETMIVLYENEETSTFMPLIKGLMQREGADVSAYTAFEDTVIDLRNEHMASRAAALIDEGNAFIAVGAAHLPGEQGLVARLRDAGYTVTRAD